VPIPKPATPYAYLLSPELTAPEAARRLLFYYYRSVTRHAQLAHVEDDPIHLH
jgi:hypothetical protein